MLVSDYVQDYQDANGYRPVNVIDYYDDYIRPINSTFGRYSFKEQNRVPCWFVEHDDKTASMGCLDDKKHPGRTMYHCFGCGKAGDVVQLHAYIQKEYKNRYLSREDAARDLAKLYNIPLVEGLSDTPESFDEYIEEKLRQISAFEHVYTRVDFDKQIRRLKELDVLDLGLLNDEVIKATATIKHLYA